MVSRPATRNSSTFSQNQLSWLHDTSRELFASWSRTESGPDTIRNTQSTPQSNSTVYKGAKVLVSLLLGHQVSHAYRLALESGSQIWNTFISICVAGPKSQLAPRMRRAHTVLVTGGQRFASKASHIMGGGGGTTSTACPCPRTG